MLYGAGGLASNHVRAILAARDGALWISTFGGGLSKFRDGKFTHVGTREGLAGDRVLAIPRTKRARSRLLPAAGFQDTKTGYSSPGPARVC